LLRVLLAARNAAVPGLASPHGEAETASWLEATLIPTGDVVVALDEAGDPAGFAAFHEGWVDQLYVAPERQRQGVGTLLLQAARPDAAGRLRLWCFQRNHQARAFYQRQGFVAARFTDGADNEEREPDLLFERSNPPRAASPIPTPRDAAPPDRRPSPNLGADANEEQKRMTDDTPPAIHKGLAGVVADTSAVSKVMAETNSLTYRGYPVQDLAEHCSFEEVAFLLINGELPGRKQLKAFREQEAEERKVSKALIRVIESFPKKSHPMDAIRTAVSFLGQLDPEVADTSEEATRRKAIRLYAKIPTAIAAAHRIRKGLRPITPRPEHGFAENIFHLIHGKVPEAEIVKAFDVSLILYAEHGFNASTFTCRTVMSTGSDLHAAVVAAIGALKGPLHGGANEAVMHMLKEVGTPANARGWIDDKLEHRALVMGFGHRVYKSGDSRVPTMTKWRDRVAELTAGQKWIEISEILAADMLEKKHIHPNLDFPTGPTYHLMGFDIPLFTPLFVASRITGWAAHAIEQLRDNRLIRPLSHYTGVPQRDVPPLKARG